MNKQAFENAIKIIAKADQTFDLERLDLNEHERGILDLSRREALFYGIVGKPAEVAEPQERAVLARAQTVRRKAERV